MIESALGIILALIILAIIISPMVMLVRIYNKVNQKPNTKIIELQDADEQIVQGTNEALAQLTERLDHIEDTLEEIRNERKEVKGFRTRD